MLNITRQYLEQMDASADDKVQMLGYVVGNSVVDVGVGSGVLGRLIKTYKPHLNVTGIEKEFQRYGEDRFKPYDDMYKVDAREMHTKIGVGEVDTVIFSSVLHEVYSYNNYSKGDLLLALESAYSLIPKGGRIIIRDGVKMEDNSNVLIKFKDPRDVHKAVRFSEDFKARKIKISVDSHDAVSMPMNDAMEFLYTYTWGEDAYKREVQEQYGVFTPKEYIQFVKRKLGMDLITCNHYLQEGHNYHLSKKVELYDEDGSRTRFPDSNILLVFQK